MPGAFSRGYMSGFLTARALTHHLAPLISHTGSASAHPAPALVVDGQGGINLGPDGGELGADFCSLGIKTAVGFTARTCSLRTLQSGLRGQGYVILLHGFPLVTVFANAVLSTMNPEVLRAYRHLFRAALRAVRYSSPAKYQIRDTMRSAFRTGAAKRLDNQRVQNTLCFLLRAELYAGMEHKILQNLLHVKYWRNQGRRDNKLLVTFFSRCIPAADYCRVNQQTDLAAAIRKNSGAHFDATLEMLNESLHTCLR
jgi:hypothetical protein